MQKKTLKNQLKLLKTHVIICQNLLNINKIIVETHFKALKWQKKLTKYALNMPYQVPAALVKTVTGWLGAGHRLYGAGRGTYTVSPILIL